MKKLFILLSALALTACASASKPGAMIAELTDETIIDDNSPLREAISVGEITGGKETNPLWTSKVSNEGFAEALRQSFAAHAMLATQDGAYRLDAEMMKLKQPIMGFNATVTSTVSYTLTDLETDDVVFEEIVTEAYTAKMGDALLGVERLRLANEGSIRTNIATLIKLMIEQLGAPSDAITEPEEEAEEAMQDASS
jgi:hypothetical protein